MPAKKIPMTLKAHVGKLFSLRQYKKIYASQISSAGGKKIELSREAFGACVFVLDESNTKVRVTKQDGSVVWIAKYFLLKEISQDDPPKLSIVFETLLKISSNYALTKIEQEHLQSAIIALKSQIE